MVIVNNLQQLEGFCIDYNLPTREIIEELNNLFNNKLDSSFVPLVINVSKTNRYYTKFRLVEALPKNKRFTYHYESEVL
tara:strand:- start:183 stop:419 length:237 start_codon:yes stop_codon:yes gene_type:complete